MNAEWFSKQYGQVVSARDFSFNPLDFFACEGPQPWTYEEQADVARLLQQPGLAPPASYRRRVAKRLIAHLEALGLEEVHDGLYASVIPGADEDADDWMAKPTRVIYTTDGLELRVEETRGLISAGGTTGLQTWPAALLLGEWILHAQLEAPGTVWELGCGTGLCSALVSKVYPGCRVYATDASGLACACARTTAESNGLGNMHVSEYEWGHELPELPLPDWVIGADITYDARVCGDLVDVFRVIHDRKADCRILIAATERNADTLHAFVRAAAKAGYVPHELANTAAAAMAPPKRFVYSRETIVRILEFRKTLTR